MNSDLLSCPYNQQHKIIPHKMPYHLVKCRQSYRGPPLEVCPYNAMHLVPAGQMEGHRENCENYHILMRATYEKLHPSNVIIQPE